MRIGWIGTGVMGMPMCRHILNKICSKNADNKLIVFNRTASKANELVRLGATFEQPEQIAKTCDVVFLMLGYPDDVRRIALDPRKGLITRMQPGSVLVDHTTSSASLAKEIFSAAEKRDIASIDAPVSGGDIGAKQGTLIVMAGGCKQSELDKVRPFIECYAKAITLFGEEPGMGQHAKLSNQIMIATTMQGLCEGLLYAYRAGLNLSSLIDLLKSGAAGSFSLTSYGPRILQRDFEPGFYVKHFVKDLGIAVEEARRMNLILPGLALAEQMYLALQNHGGADCGTQALMLCLEKINNTKVGRREFKDV